MAGGYDGAVRIDTKINEKGFNAGVSKVGTALKGMMGKISTGLSMFSIVALGVVAAIASIAAALITAGIVAFKFLERVTMDMYKALSPASAYYSQVSALKGAFDALNGSVQGMFSSLLTAATPVLMKIINWLINIINLVSMILAALAGQKTYMKYISGAAQQSARSTGKSAKNTKDMEKAAKGALAAWDELNVLQMQQPEEDTDGGGYGGGNIMFEETAIDSSILTTIENIKKWLTDAWTWIKTTFLAGAVWVEQNIVTPMVNWFIGAWDWIKQAAADAWEFIISVFTGAIGFIKDFSAWYTGVWQSIHDWIKQGFQAFVEWYTAAWQSVHDWINEFAKWYTGLWQGVHDWFIKAFQAVVDWYIRLWQTIHDWIAGFAEWYTGLWQGVQDWFIKVTTDAWGGIQKIWAAIGSWFTENIIDPLTEAWETFTDWLGETWDGTWEGVKEFVRTTINTIITFINSMISAIAGGINTVIKALNKVQIKIPDWVPVWGGEMWGLNIPTMPTPQIPLLAQGAVIPPNAKFAAILGDQTSGRNIEAPESLIRQIVREEMGGGESLTVTMPVYLDGEKIYENQKKIDRRRGKSLAFGGA